MKPMKFEEVHRLLVNVVVVFFIFLGIMTVVVFIVRHTTNKTSTPSLPVFSLPPLVSPGNTQPLSSPPTQRATPPPSPSSGDYYPYNNN